MKLQIKRPHKKKHFHIHYFLDFDLSTTTKWVYLPPCFGNYSILFFFILFYSIFYFILFYFILSILFYFILFYSILFYSILFYSILFFSILFYSMQSNTVQRQPDQEAAGAGENRRNVQGKKEPSRIFFWIDSWYLCQIKTRR